MNTNIKQKKNNKNYQTTKIISIDGKLKSNQIFTP